MKKPFVVLGLSVLPLLANADNTAAPAKAATPPAAAATPVAPRPATAAPAPVTEEAAGADATQDGGQMWRAVTTTLGVVGGVLVADWFVGGSLLRWGSTTAATTGPVVYSPEVLGARAAGAVLGEMIAPATALRDVAARKDMVYTFVLGVGAVAGAMVSYWMTGSSSEAAASK